MVGNRSGDEVMKVSDIVAGAAAAAEWLAGDTKPLAKWGSYSGRI